jgi:hypothetical protein
MLGARGRGEREDGLIQVLVSASKVVIRSSLGIEAQKRSALFPRLELPGFVGVLSRAMFKTHWRV